MLKILQFALELILFPSGRVSLLAYTRQRLSELLIVRLYLYTTPQQERHKKKNIYKDHSVLTIVMKRELSA